MTTDLYYCINTVLLYLYLKFCLKTNTAPEAAARVGTRRELLVATAVRLSRAAVPGAGPRARAARRTAPT